MKAVCTLLIVIIYTISCDAQSKQQRLLVAEYKKYESGRGNYSYLTAYNFKNGRFISKDTIFEGPTSNKNKERPSASFQGRNIIYKNRYVIGNYGTIIDVKTRKRLGEVTDHFIQTLGDTLIYRRYASGYLAYDLKTGIYDYINDSTRFKPRFSTSSPNNLYYLGNDYSTPYKVCLYDYVGNKRILVHDAGSGPALKGGTQLPRITTWWLNNNSFLYVVHHRKKSAQDVTYHKVELRKHNLVNNSDQSFFTLDSIPRGSANDSFYKNQLGETIYRSTGGSPYLLDTLQNKLHIYPEYKYPNDFSMSPDMEGMAFKYKGASIGAFRARGVFVDKGVLATEYIDKESTQGNSKGIKIWTAKTKKWATFDIPWAIGIIGWLHEE